MLKVYIMKRKFLTNTYLRGVDKYILMQFEDDSLDCYTVIKKVNSIDKPYISTHTGKGVCLLKEGYYMVEYLPKNEKSLMLKRLKICQQL